MMRSHNPSCVLFEGIPSSVRKGSFSYLSPFYLEMRIICYTVMLSIEIIIPCLQKYEVTRF